MRLTTLLAALLFAAASAFAQSADLAIQKSGPAVADPDTDVAYTITILNVGPDAATVVTFNDNIPAGMTFTSYTPGSGPLFGCTTPAVGSGGSVTCTTAQMLSGETSVFTLTFHIDPTAVAGSFLTNVATVNEQGPGDPNSENDSSTAVTQVTPKPVADMGVTKTAPANAGPDTDITYTITVSNGGPSSASNVTVADTLPGNLQFGSFNQTGGMTCTFPAVGAGGTITCSATTFAVGTDTLTIVAHVPPKQAAGTIYNNTVTVKSDNDPNPENDRAVTATTVSSADVGVVKSGPATALAGSNISYTITVTNNGPDFASDVTMVDPLPPNTTFVSLTRVSGPTATCDAATVSCNIPFFPSGQTAVFTLVLTAGNTLSVTNTASVTSTSSFDPNPNNDSSSTIVAITPVADVGVTKSGPASVTAGTSAVYTVVVTNAGPSDATNVTMTDAAPAGTSFVSLTQSGPAFTCTTGATVTCSIAALPPAASTTFTLTYAVPSSAAAGALSNTATVSTTTLDQNSANNASTSNGTIATSADVSVTKTGPGAAVQDRDVIYTVTVANAGPSDATNVSLSDPAPAQTTFVSVSQTSGPAFTCAASTCTAASLIPGATATFQYTFHVVPGTTGSISNTATVTAADDTTPANNTATVTTAIGSNIPALSPLGLALLALALGAVATFVVRRG